MKIQVRKKKNIYINDREVGILVRHKKYKHMYYYKFPNGTLSDDFYNISRAVDNFLKEINVDY